MYAIIAHGGRQYRVEEGQTLEVDYQSGAPGDKIKFDRVLLLGGDEAKLGSPLLDGASVAAEIVGTVQGPKLVVQKFRRRKNSRRRTGHRQMVTKVKIGKISG